MKKILTILDNIEEFINKRDLTEIEADNIYVELYAMLERLRNGNYKYTDFVNRNKYDIYRRTREFFIYFKSYYNLASTISKVLETFDLKNYPHIIDLCPGWAPKLEIALKQLDYTGEVTVIDYSNEATNELTDFIQLFKPEFSVNIINKNIYDLHNTNASLVVANHIIDDLLINEYCTLHEKNLVDVYTTETVFLETIQRIPEEINIIEFIKKTVLTLDKYISNNGYLIISQYGSLTDKNLGISNWVKLITDAFQQVIQSLKEIGYKDHSQYHSAELNKYKERYFNSNNIFILRKNESTN